MLPQIVGILLLSVVTNFIDAARDIVPSPEECAKYPNEEFAIDLARCQNTCEFYGRTFDCQNYYKPRGDCYCKKGFARIEEDGECVSITENAACVARLSIQPGSCTGLNEVYVESVYESSAYLETCLSFGLTYSRGSNLIHKWSPNCACEWLYRRLSNGTCVHMSDASCVSESNPSPARCEALGLIYEENAPCQNACPGQTYCPSANGGCVCPPNKTTYVYTAHYSGSPSRTIELIDCYSKAANCPAPAAA
ncbi:hypothetical protein HA402_005012 [Bradysia odoriphaga]|nr:hypothetical protein HA402_005012 [Bradysia odoriphaga]